MIGFALANDLARLILRDLWLGVTVILTKGLVLFVAAFLANRLLPVLHASHRHLLWLLVVLGFGLLPAARLVGPVLPLTLSGHSAPQAVVRLATAPSEYQEHVAQAITPARATPERGSVPGAASEVPLALTLLWLAGFVGLSLQPVAGLAALRRACRRAVSPASYLTVLQELARAMGVRRVSLVVHPRVSIPCTYGAFRPRIVLPEASRSWPRAWLHAVLIHELTHIKRRDYLTNLASRLVCALIWFNPLPWIARKLMLHEAEIACDDSVISRGIDSGEYSSAIVSIVRSARGRFMLSPLSNAVARRGMLFERVRRLLSGDASGLHARAAAGRRVVALFCLMLPLLAMTLTPKATAGAGLQASCASWFCIAAGGSLQSVQAALKAGYRVEDTSPTGRTALMSAAADNPDPAVVSVLLKAGARIDARDVYGTTPLLAAAATNPNSLIVTTLLRAGAKLSERDRQGCTPLLDAAAFNKNPLVISRLLEAGAEMSDRDRSGMTALMRAASHQQHEDVVEVLLRAGARTDDAAADGKTSLMLAAEQGSPDAQVVSALLRFGARINDSDAEGRTPLMFAAANNTAPGLVVSLLRAGARVNDTDDGGLTPLMYAAGYGPCAQTIAVLLRAGASARTRDYRGETALDLLRRNPLLKDSPAFDVLRKAAL